MRVPPLSLVPALLALFHSPLTAAAPAAVAPARARPTSKVQPAPRPRPPARGVRGMFDTAQALYDAGKFEAALGAYEALLRKYPGHEPANIQLAKTLYRLDRFKDAYAVFARLSPQHLDPETSYEFGWSFYQNKAWDGCLAGFRNLPAGHAFYDLANYYGGICAIKLKAYDDAESMLDKAVVLPDKLAKSRSLYVKHVQALRLMQQKNALAQERDQERAAARQAKDAKLKPARDQPVSAGTSGAASSVGYVHKGHQEVDKEAALSYATEHQYLDNHGFKEQASDAKVTSFAIKSGPIIPLPVTSGNGAKERQGAIGAELQLAAENRTTTGSVERVLLDETDDDLARILNEDLTRTEVKSGIAGAELWLELPLPEELWVAVGGEVSLTFPEFERGRRLGYRRGFASLTGLAGGVTYAGKVTYGEVVNNKTKPVSTTVASELKGEAEPVPKLETTLTATYTMYDYLIPELKVNGPDAAARLEGEVTQVLPLGFKLALLGAYEQHTNYIVHNLPTFGQASADARVLSGRLKLEAKPLSFIKLEISELISKITWQLADQETKDPFELNVPDYLEQLTVKASLYLAF